jgi:lipopolysaccharide exporter
MLRRFVFNSELTFNFFHFGKYTFGTNLFAGLSRSFDHFITASALGPVAGKNYVAYYNTVARINNMVDVPSLAAADVLYPKNVEALENEGTEKVKYYFEQVTGTIIAFIIPLSLFIFLFPKLIIYIIAGPEYYPAITILQLTILFSMVRPLSYQFGSTLDAIGHPQVNFLANTFLMLLNFFLTYLFLKLFGGIGAAYATIIYYVASLVTMIILLKKYINIDPKNIITIAVNRYKEMWKYLNKLKLKS